MGSQKRHQKYWESKARSAWNMIQRLSNLPWTAKRTVVINQISAILTYGAELYPVLSETQKRLMADATRWAVGAWRGSNIRKVSEIAGITELEEAMRCKRIRYAASLHYQSSGEWQRY